MIALLVRKGLGRAILAKAEQLSLFASGPRKEVQAPGSRGGKVRRTKTGKVAYSELKPTGRLAARQSFDSWQRDIVPALKRQGTSVSQLGIKPAELRAAWEQGKTAKDLIEGYNAQKQKESAYRQSSRDLSMRGQASHEGKSALITANPGHSGPTEPTEKHYAVEITHRGDRKMSARDMTLEEARTHAMEQLHPETEAERKKSVAGAAAERNVEFPGGIQRTLDRHKKFAEQAAGIRRQMGIRYEWEFLDENKKAIEGAKKAVQSLRDKLPTIPDERNREALRKELDSLDKIGTKEGWEWGGTVVAGKKKEQNSPVSVD